MKDRDSPSADLGASSFRILVEAVTDYAIYMLDAQGRVATWNTGAQRFKGYRAEEIIGRHFSQFYGEEDRRNGVPQRALQVAAETGKFEAEGWRIRKDGSRFWAHVVIDPIRDPSGALIGYAKITRDLTERREAQTRLEEAREALFQSQKMESLGQLTGGVAHDFNNVLTAIIGSLELIERRLAGDPRNARLVANAMQAARRGAGLTQRMLAFARRQELTPTAVDLRALLAGMEELLDRSLGASATPVIDTPPDLPPVHADHGQVEMALLNLALNARDAMPNGGPIVIAARPRDLGPDNPLRLPPGRYVGLSVRDQGTGMDAATLARAAEPFFTTKGVGKGTGLGLAMVHGLAEQLGGRLDLESAPGRGTTATLWLPVSRESTAAATADEPDAAPDARRRALRVLAVDDDALVLLNTAMMLEESGHMVQTAYSAAEALAQLNNRPFDLLVTDQGMPGTTGLELIAAAQALRPGLRALLVTGYAELPAGLPRGIERLAKPFHETHLADAVARTMRDEPAR